MKKHFVKRIVSVLLAGAILVSSIPAVQTRAAYREDAQSIVYETETYQVTGKITNEWQNLDTVPEEGSAVPKGESGGKGIGCLSREEREDDHEIQKQT